ncbi:hypothetical protein VNO80_10950 [Phaseolus coccineus]|uniref:Reverse transcriptase Ty1/copia-type domain-containing protein n=1 Tax=Phaseolus coccineus TaxID=3886 RepID=A0AAN9NEB8_PHACN
MATENSSFVQPAIPRFDGHYDHWAMLMENFLRSKEYWGLIENGIPATAEGVEPTEAQLKRNEDQKLKDLKVKNYLFQAIDRTTIETILNKETAKAIWDSMRQKYQGSTKVKRAQLQALRREFEILGMKEGEKVDEYFARTLTIANKMKAHGERMEQIVIIEKILRSMTVKFNYVVCSIEESNDLSTMTIDELQSSLLVHEQRMQGQKEEEHALNITNSEQSRGRDEHRVEGRGRVRGSFRGRGRGRGNDEDMFKTFKESMKKEFDMYDLGRMRYFLGVEVVQNSDGIFICQSKYAEEVLERFGMERRNPVNNPIIPGCRLSKSGNGAVSVDATKYKQLVGSLLYLTVTRPDLMYAVGLISRYMEKPTEMHLQAAKRILRYLKGTVELGIGYRKGSNGSLIAFADSDYAGDVDDRRSTSGYVFMLGTWAVSWSSKKQPVVTLSTTEAEFIAVASCACQGVWLRRVLEKLGHVQGVCTTIYCDNSFAIRLSRNPVLHGRSKHIDVRFHFLRDLTRDGIVELVRCSTQEQVADIMTKPLKLEAFLKLRDELGICVVSKGVKKALHIRTFACAWALFGILLGSSVRFLLGGAAEQFLHGCTWKLWDCIKKWPVLDSYGGSSTRVLEALILLSVVRGVGVPLSYMIIILIGRDDFAFFVSLAYERL